MIKRITAFILCICLTLIMAISFVGCSGDLLAPPSSDNSNGGPQKDDTSFGSSQKDGDPSSTDDKVKPPEMDCIDGLLSALEFVGGRPDFKFRFDLSNTVAGESSPINSDYYIRALTVSNFDYAEFVEETSHTPPSYWKNGKVPNNIGTFPVVNITYEDAVSYCEWLSSKYRDWDFRLPTEAEWENAAYGEFYGDPTKKYPNGDKTPSYDSSTGVLESTFTYNGVIAAKLLQKYGKDHIINYVKGDFAGTSVKLGDCISISEDGVVLNWFESDGEKTRGAFVETDLYQVMCERAGCAFSGDLIYESNSLRLYEMSGCCWEFTSSVISDGIEGGETRYAVRGGSWNSDAEECAIYYRGEGVTKNYKSMDLGFRIVAENVSNS